MEASRLFCFCYIISHKVQSLWLKVFSFWKNTIQRVQTEM